MTQGSSNSPDTTKSVVLAHPHRLIREGIAAILQEAGFQVIGQTDSGSSLRQLATQVEPDIILLDSDVSGIDLDVVRRLAENNRGAIVLLTRPPAPEAFLRAMRAGAMGCLSVDLSSQEFVQALRLLAEGDVFLVRGVTRSPRRELDNRRPFQKRYTLSEREREVLDLLGQGASNRQIAEKLIISEHTVKFHLRSLLNKLNIRNRQQAATYAVRQRIATETSPETSSDTVSLAFSPPQRLTKRIISNIPSDS